MRINQIGERWDDVNPHGISLRESLVPPQRMKFTHWLFRDGAVAYTNIDAWLVLEERLKTPDGYKIIYDEQTGKCGLALRGWYNGCVPQRGQILWRFLECFHRDVASLFCMLGNGNGVTGLHLVFDRRGKR